jgi:glycine/D-amino acid oxidase-like deaminating enzyme
MNSLPVMNKEILIVGHGLAGCTLAMTCIRRNIPFKIIGCSLPGEASLASSGIIAPITGRRYVKAWMIDELVEKAKDFYQWSEAILQATYFFPIEIVRYLSHPESKKAWDKRLHDPQYAAYFSDKRYDAVETLQKPYGILTGGWRLDTPGWINHVRTYLQSEGVMEVSDKPFYPDESREGITIFATGALNPAFAPRIVPNKGESLLVRMPQWNIQVVIKEEVFVLPVGGDVYWVGSFYEPLPLNLVKSEKGKEQILAAVRKFYSGDLEILDHFAGVRPTVNDRRPMIGKMPGQDQAYMFNGMGTKGTSLAPYWAEELLSHIIHGKDLSAEVSPDRYITEPVYKSLS